MKLEDLRPDVVKPKIERFIDRNGKPIREGTYVRMVEVPASLLEDLPAKDQRAIKAAATKPLLVSDLMVDFKVDDIELEFTDPTDGNFHWIWVAGKYLENA